MTTCSRINFLKVMVVLFLKKLMISNNKINSFSKIIFIALHFITSHHIYKRMTFGSQLSHVCRQQLVIIQIFPHTTNLTFDSY